MANQISTEEESNLKRQVRRRVIGAVALFLLLIIFIPIVFDSEPAPTAGNNIELRIPDKDKAPEFQPKIDLPQLDKMASEVAAAPTAEPAPAPAMVLSPAPETQPTPAVAPPKPEAKPKSEPQAKPKAEPQPKPQPKVESKPAAKPQAAVPKTGWGVQVGAFANLDTARSLQAKLSKQGYHAYTEKAGNVTRVRIGSYPTREAAEKVQGKLAGQGMQANVVSLE